MSERGAINIECAGAMLVLLFANSLMSVLGRENEGRRCRRAFTHEFAANLSEMLGVHFVKTDGD